MSADTKWLVGVRVALALAGLVLQAAPVLAEQPRVFLSASSYWHQELRSQIMRYGGVEILGTPDRAEYLIIATFKPRDDAPPGWKGGWGRLEVIRVR